MTFADITINMVKAYYGIAAGDTTYDARLTIILPSVVDMIKSYCRHDFEVKARTEYPFVKPATYQLYAKYRPVSESPAPVVTEDGVTLALNSSYAVNYDIGLFEKVGYSGNIFSQGSYGSWNTTPRVVVLSYTGGVALTNDVVLVLYEICGIFAYMKTKTYVNNQGVEAAVTITSVPAELLLILERYKFTRI